MSSTKNKNIYYLVGIGLLVRLIIFIFFYTHITIFPDSSGYIKLANQILDFDLSGYYGRRSPGYPLLITLAFGNLYVLVFFQFILGILSSVFWYKSLIKLSFSERKSLYISIFLSTLLNVIFFETSVLVESFALFLLSSIIYKIILTYNRETNFQQEFLTGFLLGVLTLVKPFYAFLPFVFYGMFVLKNFRWQSLVNKKVIWLLFPLLAYFGWSYVNKLNTGYFVSTTFYGLNTAQNCVRFAEKAPEKYKWIYEPYVKYRDKSLAKDQGISMAIWDAYNAGAYDKYNLSFNEFSSELGNYAKATIKQNPWDYLHQVIFYSWKDFWKPVVYWNYEAFDHNNTNRFFSLIWSVQKNILWLFRLFFVLLFPFYIFKAFKERKIGIELIVGMSVILASILQALVTYGTNNRFSFPFEFIMVFVVLLFLNEYGAYFYKLKKRIIK